MQDSTRAELVVFSYRRPVHTESNLYEYLGT